MVSKKNTDPGRVIFRDNNISDTNFQGEASLWGQSSQSVVLVASSSHPAAGRLKVFLEGRKLWLFESPIRSVWRFEYTLNSDSLQRTWFGRSGTADILLDAEDVSNTLAMLTFKVKVSMDSAPSLYRDLEGALFCNRYEGLLQDAAGEDNPER
ncbi:hypothetical protein [Pseudomonas gessardii]|uniref:hypothetical protein n=1 Tax=Pseudomonas gessardii TaxID=78544 RepID=UPI0018D965AC|nr:hypothetical protein [Pseudomonas gessardii]MBH3425933.1 hypothetical protein [Pseudomonas gessardii]